MSTVRLHFYLPGWETPKLEKRLFTNHYGFVSDYLAEAVRELRKQSFTRALDEDFALGSDLSARDEKAVRKTVSGLLKLLHPHGEWAQGELREYLEFALEGRRRVKEQLKKLAAHDYAKTSFSYIERDTDREVWVEVPEQPEETNEFVAISAARPRGRGPPAGRTYAARKFAGAVDQDIRGHQRGVICRASIGEMCAATALNPRLHGPTMAPSPWMMPRRTGRAPAPGP